ncbi:MAG: transposase [Cyanobacteriota bacterium]|nr:transposase [Cyanobacteriota bacterium]
MYQQGYACYPERICADCIYLDSKNRNFCTRNNMRLSGKWLGRPPMNLEIIAAHKNRLSADQTKCNEVERFFGSCKRKYSIDLIMARSSNDVEDTILMAFVVMCAENILRCLRLFSLVIPAWFVLDNALAAFGSASGTFGRLQWPIQWLLFSQVFGPTTRRWCAVFRPNQQILFAGVPNSDLSLFTHQRCVWSVYKDVGLMFGEIHKC